MTSVPTEAEQQAIRERLDSLLGRLNDVEPNLRSLETDKDKKFAQFVKKLNDEFDPGIEELNRLIKQLVDEIDELYYPNRGWLNEPGVKYIRLSFGTISERVSTSVEIVDAVALHAWAQARRLVRKLTKQPPKTPQFLKDAIKELRDQTEHAPGVKFVDTDNVSISTPKLSKAIVKPHPHRRAHSVHS